MSTAVQQKLAWLLAAIVLALAFAVSSPDFADAQDGAQTWEYAQVAFFVDEGRVVVVVEDENEAVFLGEQLTDLTGGRRENTRLLNTFGRVGWELVTLDTVLIDSGGSYVEFTFKRPLP